MNDQVASLTSRGLSAACVGGESECSPDQIREICEGKYKIVFGTPEALLNNHRGIFQSPLKKHLKAVFIDESHCIAKWGTNTKTEEAFRKDYGRLGELRSLLNRNVPFIALTATATPDVRAIIVKDLTMRDCVRIISDPNKPNISEHLGTHAYYRPSDQEPVDDRSKIFAMYHKKTHKLVKSTIEREFCEEDGIVRVVFCTIAFGMGVNVKGAHLVIHVGPSGDLDDYLQESGRIGRTGNQLNHAILLRYKGCTRKLAYRSELAQNCCHEKLLTGLDYATGYSSMLVNDILKNIKYIESLQSLKSQFFFYNDEHAVKTWEIICDVLSLVTEQVTSSNETSSIAVAGNNGDASESASDCDSEDSNISIAERT
ncbi:Werner syndrome ATP-dependent helicase, partial [Paramuricea clavata]